MQVLKQGFILSVALLLGGCQALVPDRVTRGLDLTINRSVPPSGADVLMSPASHSFRRGVVTAGDPVRRGNRSERFELRDGDCGGSDCANPRARAEIELDGDALPNVIGQDAWYGWSFYNESVPSFTKKNSLRLVFGQWTMGGTNRPIFRFIQLGADEGDFANCDPSLCKTANPTSGDLVVQLNDIAAAMSWDSTENDGYVCRLFDLSERRGQWVDIIVNTNFSAGNDGYLRIWVDQRLVCNYSGPLVSAASLASGRPIAHRRGVYSSWTKRWAKAEKGRRKPNLIVYYDEFRAGEGMSEVDIRQLEAAAIRPVD